MAEDMEGTAAAVAVVLTLGGGIGVVDPALMLVIDEVGELPGAMVLLVGQ